MTSACSTSASASSRRPAPSARAIADEMPPPMAPAEIICTSMTTGKNQRHARERVGAELGDEPGLDQAGRRLRQHHEDVRPGHAQQRRHDRCPAAATRVRGLRSLGARLRSTASRRRGVRGSSATATVMRDALFASCARLLRVGRAVHRYSIRDATLAYLRRVRSGAAGPGASAYSGPSIGRPVARSTRIGSTASRRSWH